MARKREISWRALAAAVALAALSVGCYIEAGSAKATETVEKTVPMQAGGSFSLENINGSIHLTAWDKPEVHLVATKKARGGTEAKAKEALAKVEVSVEAEGSKVSVTTKHPKRSGFAFGGSSVTVRYEVQVPRGTKVSLTTVNGSVEAEAPGSDVACESVNGSLEVKAAGSLRAQSVNGKIEFRATSLGSVSTTNGSVRGLVAGPQAGEGSVETVNGSVTLEFPGGLSATLEAENVNGSLECDLPGFSVEKHRASGRLGSGGPTISVETVNGSIKLRSAATAAAAAAPAP